MNYPIRCSRHFQQRWDERGWKQQSPTLVLRGKHAALHFPQASEGGRNAEAGELMEARREHGCQGLFANGGHC
jgi:hypothetical protein